MRFLADMGIARDIVIWLREQGHDAVHLLDEGLERLSDAGVLDKAAAESRILLTFDLDFGELVALAAGRKMSVILFRLRNARYERVRERLEHCLHQVGADLGRSAIVVVEDGRIRVRPLPVR